MSVPSYDVSSMGRRVARLRAERGLSLRQLEALTGTSKATLSRIERGEYANPTLGTLVALGRALEVNSLEELFGPMPTTGLMRSPGEASRSGERSAPIVLDSRR